MADAKPIAIIGSILFNCHRENSFGRERLATRCCSLGISMTNLKIECAKDFSPTLLQAVTSLLPQLTSSGRALSSKELKVMIASPFTTLFVAKDEGKIIGMISLAVVQMPTGVRAYLEDLVVDSPYRNRGAATCPVTGRN